MLAVLFAVLEQFLPEQWEAMPIHRLTEPSLPRPRDCCRMPEFLAAWFRCLCCGDGQLALAIVRNSGMLVHADYANRKNTDALATLADAEGFLARRLYVETGSVEAMPYAYILWDLIILSALADADLVGLPSKEMLRVLSPSRGSLFVGRSKPLADDGKLTKAALDAMGVRAWPCRMPRFGRMQLASGPWFENRHCPVRKAGRIGITGLANNLFSADATLRDPLLTQWMGLPMHEGWWGTAVVSDAGQDFHRSGSRSRGFDRPNTLSLTARSIQYRHCVVGTSLDRRTQGRLEPQDQLQSCRCRLVAAWTTTLSGRPRQRLDPRR